MHRENVVVIREREKESDINPVMAPTVSGPSVPQPGSD